MVRGRTDASHLLELRDHLHRLLEQCVPGLTLNGHPLQRLPNTLNISFPNADGRALLSLAAEDVAASVGSACHEEDDAVSGVLGAMGVTAEQARGAVRLSLGHPTTKSEIEHVASVLVNAWLKRRGHQ